MRFDDMIATVLRQPEAPASALTAKWRQLVDLLAQRRRGEVSVVREAMAWLRERRGSVPRDVRRAAARSLAGRRVSPEAVAFFAEDHPGVAGELLGTAQLAPERWIALLPRLSPTARGLLRHRRDLPADVVQALAAFGSTDFALGGDVAQAAASVPEEDASPSAERSEAQIRELVARIENFRRRREAQAAVPPVPEPRCDEFQWETGTDGIILWVQGAPRGPLVGESIASIAERGQFGVDGQAAGAFEKRAPFRDARFSVAGSGAASGDWRISGVPFFDALSGAFLGYRGTARRPRLDEVAHAAEPAGLFGTDLPPDSLRQLIHELRTPLNAILGFAEMIDGQYMGPASLSYRSRASDIMEQARRLLSAVDDLDTAARIETRRLQLADSSVDAVALLCRLHDAYERVARQRGSRIAIEIERDLPAAKVETDAAERMFARMLAATIGLAREGEVIAATMAMGQNGARKMLCLSIDRPQAIAGLEERALLDPGYSPDGDWPGAPVLGLGFALRLVRNLAEAVGGALRIGDSRFFLYLPPDGPAERSSGQGG